MNLRAVRLFTLLSLLSKSGIHRSPKACSGMVAWHIFQLGHISRYPLTQHAQQLQHGSKGLDEIWIASYVITSPYSSKGAGEVPDCRKAALSARQHFCARTMTPTI